MNVENTTTECASTLDNYLLIGYAANDLNLLKQPAIAPEDKELFARIWRGKKVEHLSESPLYHLQDLFEKNCVTLQDARGVSHSFGCHLHGIGGPLVKGHNLDLRRFTIDGKELLEIDFKVNHVFRGRLEEVLQYLKMKQETSNDNLQKLLELAGSQIKNLTVSHSQLPKTQSLTPICYMLQSTKKPVWQIGFEGLGTVFIGADPSSVPLYNKVIIQLDNEKNIGNLHAILSVLDLDRAISPSTPEELERLKIAHLFHTFFPSEAILFERTLEFFTIPLDEFKAQIFQRVPEMKEVIKKYFHKMEPEYLLGGKVRYRIKGLADAAYATGARSLTVTNVCPEDKDALFERVAAIIKMGFLSIEYQSINRHFTDINLSDCQPYESDCEINFDSIDSIYTQMFTKEDCNRPGLLTTHFYDGEIRFLISLEALEMGSYQYQNDYGGKRGNFEEYAQREGILQFIKTRQNNIKNPEPYMTPMHEIMLKDYLSPRFIKGLIVKDKVIQSELLAFLEERHLIQEGKILGIPSDQFIRISKDVITEELIYLNRPHELS